MDAASSTANIAVTRHCQATAAEFKAAGSKKSLYSESIHTRALDYALIMSAGTGRGRGQRWT